MTATNDSRRRLYERYVSTHTATPAERTPGARAFPVIRGLPPDRSARVLDIGCGEGALVAAMQAAGYTDVTGIDTSPEQVVLAHAQGRTEVLQANVFDHLTEHPGEFNVVTATDVFEHFDHDEVVRLMDAVYSALRPGGVLVAQVPNATSPFFGNYAFGDFTHRSVFTARSVRQVCLTAGFASTVAQPVGPQVHGLVSALRRVAWSGVAGLLKLSLASETGQLRGHLVTQNLVFIATRAPA